VFAISPVIPTGPIICEVRSITVLSLYINTPLPLLNKGRHSVTQKGIPVVVLVVVEVEELVVVLVELELVVLVVVDVLVELVELELVVVVVIL
jgi:hypothetical protein